MALNAGLVVVLIVAAVLVYAFTQRVASPRPDPERLENPGDLLGDYIQLEVRNGTQVNHLAAEMKEYLTGLGFDVVDDGNYTRNDVERTIIIDQVGNPDAAEQVAMALGADLDRIEDMTERTWIVDATIVIGADYAQFKPYLDRLGVPEDADSDAESDSTDN